MGWTSYHAKFYGNRGQINRKMEIESNFSDGYSVVKSAMVGSVYYGAIRHGDDVFGLVVLTSVDNKDWYNFSYKMMDETEGPCESRCPKSILDLLTPTDSEFALAWRQRCRENIERGGSKAERLRKLPIGAQIEFTDREGKTHRFFKCAPSYQFRRPFWMNSDMLYIKLKNIPDDFRVVEERTRGVSA